MNHLLFTLFFLLWLLLISLLYRTDRRRAHARHLWKDVLAGGLLWLLVYGFFWRTLSGGTYQPADGGDLASFLYPTYRFAAAELAQGRLPLWNPTLYGGAPFIGDIQAGFFYPPNLLLFLLAPTFPYSMMQVLVIVHLFWAGLGMYILVRSMRWPTHPVSRPAAFFAAVGFTFCDPFLIHVGNLNLIATLSWLPWILAACARSLESRRFGWAALAGFLLAISTYAGHAQSTFYIGLALVLYTAGRLATDALCAVPSQRQGWTFPVASLALTGGVGILLAAPVLLPAAELTAHTIRAGFTYQETVAYSLAPVQMLAGFVTPGIFGRGPALHWGLWERVELPYLGVPVLLFAMAGILLAQPEQRRLLWTWAGITLLGLTLALGIYTVVHGWFTFLLPIFDQFRAPARALILYALGMCVLAAVGFDAIGVHMARTPVLSMILKGGALLLGSGVIATYALFFVTQDNETTFLRVSLAALALVLAVTSWLATWALTAMRQHHHTPFNTFAALAIGILFLELAAAGAYTDIAEADPAQSFSQPEILSFLSADPDLFRIDTRTNLEGLWQPNTAALAGLQDVGGVANPLMLRSFADFWESIGGRETRRYDLLNVKYVLVKEGTPLPPQKFSRVFGPVNGIEIHENSAFVPRAWLAPSGVDLNNTEPPAAVSAAAVRIYSATHMAFDLQAPEAGYLVISENWYPGWIATVNGTATPVQTANGTLRAVAVPAGASSIEMLYRPDSFTWALWATLAGIGVLLVVGFLETNGSRRA